MDIYGIKISEESVFVLKLKLDYFKQVKWVQLDWNSYASRKKRLTKIGLSTIQVYKVLDDNEVLDRIKVFIDNINFFITTIGVAIQNGLADIFKYIANKIVVKFQAILVRKTSTVI